MNSIRIQLSSLCVLALSPVVWAQSNISPLHKFAWSENIGWTNWRDSGVTEGLQGADAGPAFLAGFVWCENTGYINLGDGTPVDGAAYSNLGGSDAGVNVLPDSRLAGLAWSENAGWLNFGPFAALPAPQQARFDPLTRRFRGYAWGENVGWINLDDPDQFVGLLCLADYNRDTVVDFFDYLDFVSAFATLQPGADFNHDAVVDFFDYLDFVQAFSRGC